MHSDSTISSWVRRFESALPDGPILDVACGSGRHLRHFQAAGRTVTGVDRDISRLADLAGAPGVELVEADLEAGAPWPLGDRRFAAVLVTNYLWRPLFPAIVGAVGPGGWLLYETFAQGQGRYGRPRNPQFLLMPGELIEVARGLHVVAYEHGLRAGPRALVQRIAAIRPSPQAVIESAPIVL